MNDFREHRTRNAVSYWFNGLTKYMLPNFMFSSSRKRLLDSLSDHELSEVQRRADYYCRLSTPSPIPTMTTVSSFRIPLRGKHRHSHYVLDLNEALCRFPSHLLFNHVFGDITEEAEFPAFVKSRPITQGPTNSVVMKLDKYRHFRFVDDHRPFGSKKDMLVSRNHVTQPHRRKLLEMYFTHPMCDIGKTNSEVDDPHPEWVKPFMTIDEQLNYKFIACIEGNDVASNLKWVMSSNSLAVMPKPKYETWFMEGTLTPGVHYIEINPDYSDLPEKLDYYISHPDEAEAIIKNAHDYVNMFSNKRLELACQIVTAEAYFRATGQIS